jgi:excisionase family DNA binding protein
MIRWRVKMSIKDPKVGAVLSSAAVARMLNVNASSVKRWADEGKLPCMRTPGGHRRFQMRHVDAFRSSHLSHQEGLWQDQLSQLLIQGRQGEAESLLLTKRAELGQWQDVGDTVGHMLQSLGARWAEGQLSISEEHVATECLMRCITRILFLFPRRQDSPVCALASAPGDEHTLGLALSELVLAENGWNGMWLGRMCPLETLVDVAKSPNISMLALSASAFSSTPTVLGDVVRTLGPTCMAHSTHLVLGGHGQWPENVFDSIRIQTFSEFGDYIRFVN